MESCFENDHFKREIYTRPLSHLCKRKWFFALFVLVLTHPLLLRSQWMDDFSDGDLAGWQGEAGHFKVNIYHQLQLDAPAGSSSSWIYTNFPFADSMVWEIYVHLAFAPSATNQLKIYLGLNSPDLAEANGYFLEIGAAGDIDAIEFKYQEGAVIHTIASSPAGIVATDPVDMRIRITCKANGHWECMDISGITPVLLFDAGHAEMPLSSFNTFGLHCKYSDTRRDKFYFDDMNAAPFTPDTTAPKWIELHVADENSVVLLFDEAIDTSISLNNQNYTLLPGNISPDTVEIYVNEIVLSWELPFESRQPYSLVISGLSDQHGNFLESQSRDFIFTRIDPAMPYDILITEIMADPSPPIDLPEAEYLEIYNPSHKIFLLSDYSLSLGTSNRELPDSILFPGEFIILVDDAHASDFFAHGKVVVLENFPALTNSGALITLKNENEIIYQLEYSDKWYHDNSKSGGGWSLEMTNPLNICSDETNWAASTNLEGGTPGQKNSIWSVEPDTAGPNFISVFTGDPGIIELSFDEKMDTDLMNDPGLYVFDPSIPVIHVEMNSPKIISIHIAAPLEEGIIYKLLPFEAFDCLGNSQQTDTVILGLISEILPGDVLVNEILFNPASGGSRFIELINASEKFIDISEISIARLSKNEFYASAIRETLPPGSIFAFCPDREDIMERYTVPQPEHLYEISLPAWDDQSDDVSILSAGMIIDSFSYSAQWHHPLIADQNGVSLERISLMSEASNPFNWHSASSLSEFGTPTGVNSQAAQLPSSNAPFTIINKNFSPDGDGFKDFLIVRFEPDPANTVASIWVHDLEGREIHQLLSNETLGRSAIVQWDGRNHDGAPADMGIYLIFVRLWDATGNVKEYQESCALIKR